MQLIENTQQVSAPPVTLGGVIGTGIFNVSCLNKKTWCTTRELNLYRDSPNHPQWRNDVSSGETT